MKDYQASYSEKFKEALRKFNDSATALYFVVQTSTSHDYEDPFTTVTVYNKKKTQTGKLHSYLSSAPILIKILLLHIKKFHSPPNLVRNL